MSDKTNLLWTDATWNVVTGCSKESEGCKNCYAERDWPRMAHVPLYMGRAFTDVQCHAERLDQPMRWAKPRKIFVNSVSDLFHPLVPTDFLVSVFAVMAVAPQHIFQVLTKRAERMRDELSNTAFEAAVRARAKELAPKSADIVWPLPNVWVGVSVENQQRAIRVQSLLATPAAVRWLSMGPLVGAVQLDDAWLPQLDWVVVEGESGPKARPMHPLWVFHVRDACARHGVPFMFKQWGEWAPRSACFHVDEQGQSFSDLDPSCEMWDCIKLTESGKDGRRLESEPCGEVAYMQRVTLKRAGRLLQGQLHDAYPKTYEASA